MISDVCETSDRHSVRLEDPITIMAYFSPMLQPHQLDPGTIMVLF